MNNEMKEEAMTRREDTTSMDEVSGGHREVMQTHEKTVQV
jgi:hypothetical protein